MSRKIELIRYRRFGDGLLLLELVNAVTAVEDSGNGAAGGSQGVSARTISGVLSQLNGPLRDLYEQLRAYLLVLGDDVQEKTLKHYVAFKRLKNFACVEVHPGKGCVSTFMKVDPEKLTLESGFTRDVREIGYYGTGDLEITLWSRTDLEKARPLVQTSYEAS